LKWNLFDLQLFAYFFAGRKIEFIWKLQRFFARLAGWEFLGFESKGTFFTLRNSPFPRRFFCVFYSQTFFFFCLPLFFA
jgi:hypothetical protein